MGKFWTIEGYVRENPDTFCGGMAGWLEGQSQEVWAQVIRGLDGRDDMQARLVLHWMIGRREIEKANVIRLFWALFDAALWIGEREDDFALEGLERLVDRWEGGFYTMNGLELSRKEATYFRNRLVGATRNAVLGGWDEATAAFRIPGDFFRPVRGREVTKRPFIRPARNYKSARLSDVLRKGPALVEAGAAEMARRARIVTRGWWLARMSELGVFAGIPGMMGVGYWLYVKRVPEVLTLVGL